MNLSEFIVEPDLRGRRLRVHWRIDFAQGEDSAPCRPCAWRARPSTTSSPLPVHSVIYDSTAFPPAGTALA